MLVVGVDFIDSIVRGGGTGSSVLKAINLRKNNPTTSQQLLDKH